MFSLCVTLMFSVRSEIVITGVGMNSLCNFTKYYSCEISLNVNFKGKDSLLYSLVNFLIKRALRRPNGVSQVVGKRDRVRGELFRAKEA